MTDSSDSSYGPRGSQTSPDAIAERTFSQAKRGYAESEVRAYLRMVAGDVAAMSTRERELAARVRDLEEQLHRPVPPPSDADLLTALGEETARVLGQARQSAQELRGKADEHARRVVREAQETARELRTTTQQAVEAKTHEAEDAARARAKEIVAEARALRERVINDLNERRTELERQIAELRAGRGKLVETYQIVERALTHATRVMAEEPSATPEVPTPPADGERESAASTPAAPVVAAPSTVPSSAPSSAPPAAPAREAAASEDAEPEPEPEPNAASEESGGPDVGALFEKLRTERTEQPDPSEPGVAADVPGAASADDETQALPTASESEADAGVSAESEDADATDDAAEHAEPEEELSPAQVAIAARDTALADAGNDLLKRGKRALQDEQNDILDGLRRQRGKIDIAKVLPAPEDQLARWAHVLQPAVDSAYSTGAATVGGPVGSAPRALLTELATATITPLRDRLSSSIESIDARTPADTEIAIAQRLGARYREWRGQELELVLGDALAVAFSRGVFDAAPDGARLRWFPAHEGKCPDCDDNALEPTVKGSEFPTGQPFPPAHPGCRCLLAVDDAE
jgi:DivIVA domain-containing protein